MAMRERKTLKTYSNRYWELFNEIDGDFDDVATSVHQLIDWIDKYKKVEEDQQQGKRKAKVVP